MTRLFVLAASAAASLALAPAVSAQPADGYYSATPATAPEKASIVTRSTVWQCGEGVCAAPKSPARDLVMCELLVKEVGRLSAFRANGSDFDSAALEKCNARAR